MFKYIFLAALLVVACTFAFGQQLDESTQLSFTLYGQKYTERVIDRQDKQFIIIPKQGDADRTIIFHDFEQEMTIFKDLTVRKCFVSPLYEDVVMKRGIIFRYQPDGAMVHRDRQIEMEVTGDAVSDIAGELGDGVAEFCINMEAFHVRRLVESPLTTADRRMRRGLSVSACGSVSVGSDGKTSASGSAAGGTGGSSASTSGNGGSGGKSASCCGSVSVGRGGVRGSVSGSVGGSSKASTSSSGGSSSSSGKGSGSDASTSGSSSASSGSRSGGSRSSRGGGRSSGGRRGGRGW